MELLPVGVPHLPLFHAEAVPLAVFQHTSETTPCLLVRWEAIALQICCKPFSVPGAMWTTNQLMRASASLKVAAEMFEHLCHRCTSIKGGCAWL